MMNFKASSVLVSFALAFLLSNAAESPAELYWKLKLGNLPMPKVLKNSLHDGSNDGTAKLNSHFQVPLDPEHMLPLADIKYGVYINYAHPTLDDRDKKTHFARPSDKLPVDGRVIYFTNEKLYTPGIKMKLHFNKIDNGAKFLPLGVAKSVVVASNRSEMVLNILSVNPKSIDAQYIKQTFIDCKEKGIKDEVRYCATSLEAMVDFITLSSNSRENRVMVVSTEQEKDVLMEYTIQKARKLGNDDNHTVVCHKLNNPYAVFVCHNIRSTDVYGVSLVGVDGKQMKAIVVCHKDTSNWYPRHLAFQLLKLKPGGEPICHFLSGDTVIWLRT